MDEKAWMVQIVSRDSGYIVTVTYDPTRNEEIHAFSTKEEALLFAGDRIR